MKSYTIGVIATTLSFSPIIAAEVPADALYLDVQQPVEKRVADLISRLTLEEKARLLNHKGSRVERFDIRAFHDHLLGAGALPMDVVETRMRAWTAAQQN